MPPALRAPHPKLSLSLILDWDGTLTTADTLAVLASTAYTSRSPPHTPWSTIVAAYLTDLRAHTSSYPHPPSHRTSYHAERAWLRSLRSIEAASARRAVDVGVFRGVGSAETTSAAVEAVARGDVRLRDGWTRTFALAAAAAAAAATRLGGSVSTSVVSVNWSRRFVCECLRAAAAAAAAAAAHGADGDDDVCTAVQACEVYANELPDVVAEVGQTRDAIESKGSAVELRTSEDKLRQMLRIRETTGNGGTNRVVYVGDSATDLECLVAADVGVVVRDKDLEASQRELKETCERIGIQVRRLQEWSAFERRGVEELPMSLWSISDFHELNDWLSRVV